MRFSLLAILLYATALVSSSPTPDTTSLSLREAAAAPEVDVSYSDLEKRKGGGGGKGGSGGGGGGGKGTGGKSGSGGRPISSYGFSKQSNIGGRTIHGSGPPPPYSGRYAGGAMVPYTAGKRSPTRNIAPYALGIGAFGFFPGIWLYGSLFSYPYSYPYYHHYDGQNKTANVTCLCQRYSVCGCDPVDNSTFIQQTINNGSLNGQPVNTSTVRYLTYPNGTEAAFINGTLPNGTTATGGTDPSSADEISAAARLLQNYGGYSLMAATVVISVLTTV